MTNASGFWPASRKPFFQWFHFIQQQQQQQKKVTKKVSEPIYYLVFLGKPKNCQRHLKGSCTWFQNRSDIIARSSPHRHANNFLWADVEEKREGGLFFLSFFFPPKSPCLLKTSVLIHPLHTWAENENTQHVLLNLCGWKSAERWSVNTGQVLMQRKLRCVNSWEDPK